MNDRFKFNAIVSSYYDIDTPDEYKEVEPRIYLHNVDVFSDEICIDYDRLLAEVEKQLKLDKPEISQVMQFFEDNSNASDFEYVTIKPDKVLQSTGLKDKNGKLIYEGDIVKVFHVSSTMQGRVFTGFVAYDNERCRYCILENKNCSYVTFSDTDDVFEVIGNIYENKELLNENS